MGSGGVRLAKTADSLEILIGKVIRKDPDQAAMRINSFLRDNGIGALNELARKSQFALFLKATVEELYYSNIALETEKILYAQKQPDQQSCDDAIKKVMRMVPQILANYEGVEKFQKSASPLQVWMGVESAIQIFTYLDEMGEGLISMGLLNESRLEDRIEAQKRLLLTYDDELYKFHDGGMRAIKWIDRFGYLIGKPIELPFLLKHKVVNSEEEYDRIPFLSTASSFDLLLQRIHEEG
ncbi:MAG: hypothetical protein KGH65_00825 [Candidatus Micrarchaeota archaeon]|nr:hypothetical protein [Candidatus Micrarchaeota archaeon]